MYLNSLLKSKIYNSLKILSPASTCALDQVNSVLAYCLGPFQTCKRRALGGAPRLSTAGASRDRVFGFRRLHTEVQFGALTIRGYTCPLPAHSSLMSRFAAH